MGWEVGRRGNGVQKRKKSRVFLLGLLRPLGMGTENEEKPQQKVCCPVGNVGEGLGLQE